MYTKDLLEIWCNEYLGTSVARQIFDIQHLSRVVGVVLTDGRTAVVKIRPAAERLYGCIAVQRQLWVAGFPCPEPLAGPTPMGDMLATAETYLPGGILIERNASSPRNLAQQFAQALAWLVRLAPPPKSLPGLAPSPAWVWWNHNHDGLWPPPDDREADLNTVHTPAWIDEVGRRIRERMQDCTLPWVTGHADWESQNLRWQDAKLYAVHDWDSVVTQPEAAVAGAASAVFPADRTPLSDASVAESQAFLIAYEQAREQPWSQEEREIAWAAGLWVRVFNAKKASLDPKGAPVIARLAEEVNDRLRYAGA